MHEMIAKSSEYQANVAAIMQTYTARMLIKTATMEIGGRMKMIVKIKKRCT
jgi:hypothetical protein